MYEEKLINQSNYLGRQWYPDERDKNFPIPFTATDRGWRYWWPNGWWGDQGTTPQCVAYSLLHKIADGPRTRPGQPAISAGQLYCEAQERDPWDGDCSNPQYDGTSVRAGAKALRDLGYIQQFRWAFSIEEVINVLLTHGPLVMGTSWYSDMTLPDKRGVCKVSGTFQGGHAYLVNGINIHRGFMRIKNSWGRNWGYDGYAWISIEDMERLLGEEWSESCLLS